MSDDICIQAEPLAVPSLCKFMVDRPIYENRSYWFGNREAAELSPLASRLFAIPGIATVLISHNTITVSKAVPDPWNIVGQAIRAHVGSGEAPVDPTRIEKMPSSEEIRQRVETVIRERSRSVGRPARRHGQRSRRERQRCAAAAWRRLSGLRLGDGDAEVWCRGSDPASRSGSWRDHRHDGSRVWRESLHVIGAGRFL